MRLTGRITETLPVDVPEHEMIVHQCNVWKTDYIDHSDT